MTNWLEKFNHYISLHPRVTGLALAGTGALFFSGKAIVVKLSYNYEVTASNLLAMRMLLALPIFLAALVYTTQKNTDRPKLSLPDLGLITLAGLLGYYLASLLDFMGLQYITAGLERLILFSYPSMVLLLSCIVQRQAPRPWQIMCMAISYLGLAVVYGRETVLLDSNTTLGSLLVLLSALSYACYLILGESLLKRLGTIRVTALATLVSAMAILLQIAISEPLSTLLDHPPGLWALSAVNAIFCTVLPVFSIMAAIRLIGAPSVAQIGMIGPIATLGLGTLILGEPFTLWHALGAVLVMTGVALLNFRKTKSR